VKISLEANLFEEQKIAIVSDCVFEAILSVRGTVMPAFVLLAWNALRFG
jgi:ABC-type uncharacterized transport system auxiliary subunit